MSFVKFSSAHTTPTNDKTPKKAVESPAGDKQKKQNSEKKDKVSPAVKS